MNFKLYYHFYLTESGEVIRILANNRPGPNTIPAQSHAWRVFEFDCIAKKWVLSSFPEITWGKLKGLRWIGKLKP